MYQYFKLKYILSLILLTAVVPTTCTAETTEREVVKVGVIAPLTGSAARLGDWIMQGIRLAGGKINSNAKLPKVLFTVEDGKCSGREAVTAFNKLKDVSRVKYILGPLCGASSVPVAPLAERNNILLMTTGLASENVLKAGENVFSVLPSMGAVAERIVEYAVNKQGYKKLSIIYSDDEYGQQNELAIKAKSKALGGKIINSEQYSRSHTEFKAHITKLNSDSSEAVIVVAYPPDYAVFLKQAYQSKLGKPLVAVSSIQAPEVALMHNGQMQPVVYSYPGSSTLPSVVAFREAYAKTKNKDTNGFVPMYVGSAYDSAMMLAEALGKCEKDEVECVRNTLLALPEFHGANGVVAFDKNGNNTSGSAIELRTLVDGEFKPGVIG